MKPIVIIPARYNSTRFPGKPLALINGKPMIQIVFEQCKKAFDQVVVATDDERIAKTVTSFGGFFMMTSPDHKSGTDRCAEAASILSLAFSFDMVINVQGDEPFVKKEQIIQIANCFNDPSTEIATLISPIKSNAVLFDTNKVKVVISVSDFALYFSRQPIPFQRDFPAEEWLRNNPYYCHLGMYAFKPDILQKISKLPQTPLESSEKLEQLRWLENNFRIKTAITSHINYGIDTPEDLKNLIL